MNLKGVHWTKYALCKLDERFTSYDISDVEYAKSICANCEVQVECILATEASSGEFISAGMSKLDRLLLQWKRVESESESSFGDSSAYVSVVVRRVGEAFHS